MPFHRPANKPDLFAQWETAEVGFEHAFGQHVLFGRLQLVGFQVCFELFEGHAIGLLGNFFFNLSEHLYGIKSLLCFPFSLHGLQFLLVIEYPIEYVRFSN